MRAAAREIRPFLGDTWAFDAIRGFARAPVPLLENGRGRPLRLTAAGRDVLAGAADHVALNGIDRWIGGVHLQGHEAAWRWHEGQEAITAH
jgi:hypothetical protein